MQEERGEKQRKKRTLVEKPCRPLSVAEARIAQQPHPLSWRFPRLFHGHRRSSPCSETNSVRVGGQQGYARPHSGLDPVGGTQPRSSRWSRAAEDGKTYGERVLSSIPLWNRAYYLG